MLKNKGVTPEIFDVWKKAELKIGAVEMTITPNALLQYLM